MLKRDRRPAAGETSRAGRQPFPLDPSKEQRHPRCPRFSLPLPRPTSACCPAESNLRVAGSRRCGPSPPQGEVRRPSLLTAIPASSAPGHQAATECGSIHRGRRPQPLRRSEGSARGISCTGIRDRREPLPTRWLSRRTPPTDTAPQCRRCPTLRRPIWATRSHQRPIRHVLLIAPGRIACRFDWCAKRCLGWVQLAGAIIFVRHEANGFVR